MPLKIIIRLLIIVNLCLSAFYSNADSLRFNTLNNSGSVGLINMPSARFYDSGTISFNYHDKDNLRKSSILLSPLNWLELTKLETKPSDKFESNTNEVIQEYNLKIRLKEEGNFPAIAIGINNIENKKSQSSEYIVASYGVNNVDYTIGLGWGGLDGLNSYENFFGQLDDEFYMRVTDLYLMNERNHNNFFKGDTFSVFGGISAVLGKNFILKFEYDTSNYGIINANKNLESRLNYSLDFIGLDFIDVGISYEYGEYYGVKISTKYTFFQQR